MNKKTLRIFYVSKVFFLVLLFYFAYYFIVNIILDYILNYFSIKSRVFPESWYAESRNTFSAVCIVIYSGFVTRMITGGSYYYDTSLFVSTAAIPLLGYFYLLVRVLEGSF